MPIGSRPVAASDFYGWALLKQICSPLGLAVDFSLSRLKHWYPRVNDAATD